MGQDGKRKRVCVFLVKKKQGSPRNEEKRAERKAQRATVRDGDDKWCRKAQEERRPGLEIVTPYCCAHEQALFQVAAGARSNERRNRSEIIGNICRGWKRSRANAQVVTTSGERHPRFQLFEGGQDTYLAQLRF